MRLKTQRKRREMTAKKKFRICFAQKLELDVITEIVILIDLKQLSGTCYDLRKKQKYSKMPTN